MDRPFGRTGQAKAKIRVRITESINQSVNFSSRVRVQWGKSGEIARNEVEEILQYGSVVRGCPLSSSFGRTNRSPYFHHLQLKSLIIFQQQPKQLVYTASRTLRALLGDLRDFPKICLFLLFLAECNAWNAC
jgi:hypothetical protein